MDLSSMQRKFNLKFREKNFAGDWMIKPRFEVKEQDWEKVEKALAELGIVFRSPER